MRGISDIWSDRGAAAVEFSLVVVMLFVLILGMIAIAQLYEVQIEVTHAAREGARMAAVNKYNADAVRARSGVPDPSRLSLGTAAGTDAGGKYVEVTASYPITVGLPDTGGGLRIRVLSTTITPRSTARMRAEF